MKSNEIHIKGPNGVLSIPGSDPVAYKMAMIIEYFIGGISPEDIAKKYGYTREHVYFVLRKFNKEGSFGLLDKVRGRKNNTIRNEVIENQIIRHRFLDPEASAQVIAQKMNQSGYKISVRSVERTITEKGLQKKTLRMRSGKRKDHGSNNKEKRTRASDDTPRQ
jgi:transposase